MQVMHETSEKKNAVIVIYIIKLPVYSLIYITIFINNHAVYLN